MKSTNKKCPTCNCTMELVSIPGAYGGVRQAHHCVPCSLNTDLMGLDMQPGSLFNGAMALMHKRASEWEGDVKAFHEVLDKSDGERYKVVASLMEAASTLELGRKL